MCGLFGTRGHQHVKETVVSGLQDLSYRGYDSWGLAMQSSGKLHVSKEVGLIPDKPTLPDIDTSLAIGHTRWSTHGEPNVTNAHPHLSADKRIAVVHNGIIDNYTELKDSLNKQVTFLSETDTEVVAHLLAEAYQGGGTLPEALRKVVKRLKGRFALLVIDAEHDQLLAFRQGSPVVAGTDGARQWIASDTFALSRQCNEAMYLEDGQMLLADAKGMHLYGNDGNILTPHMEPISTQSASSKLEHYQHFMRQEIDEQAAVIHRTTQAWDPEQHLFPENALDALQRIIILGCGTSWHAGLVAEYWLERYARLPVDVEYASEFRYRDPLIQPGDCVIAISQSGETADTNAAVDVAKEKGAYIIALCNTPGSTLTRLADHVCPTHAGMEIGVASTKAFTTQLVVLYQISIWLAEKLKNLDKSICCNKYADLDTLPEAVTETLQAEANIKTIAEHYHKHPNALYLGRGLHFPIALEGALKLKEVSYVHAEGYPAAEMKHGPIALIDSQMPVVVVAIQDHTYEKVLANIAEIKARQGRIIAIGSKNDTQLTQGCDHVITVPNVTTDLMPLITVLPLQLLAYHIAAYRGCDIDKPRNLAKSVTVE